MDGILPVKQESEKEMLMEIPYWIIWFYLLLIKIRIGVLSHPNLIKNHMIVHLPVGALKLKKDFMMLKLLSEIQKSWPDMIC